MSNKISQSFSSSPVLLGAALKEGPAAGPAGIPGSDTGCLSGCHGRHASTALVQLFALPQHLRSLCCRCCFYQAPETRPSPPFHHAHARRTALRSAARVHGVGAVRKLHGCPAPGTALQRRLLSLAWLEGELGYRGEPTAPRQGWGTLHGSGLSAPCTLGLQKALASSCCRLGAWVHSTIQTGSFSISVKIRG